ncbi:protein Brevis radix-like 4 isoform X2 [Olea europaea var. sylvestris]|uniref:protein Brevis radix-like 4 isoform X2 n=1 Tax=Olea europaea var. sylvestris TaxID=158386 RepID=UPI000C1CECDD|nr:protein Brevis radix-like 4 isoform X2 [Olea europaea var. sylvestris]
MPAVYDNWGRLLQAVLRRQQYLEMAHAHSRSTSSASSVSLDFDELSLNSPSEEKTVENEGRSSRSDFGPSHLINDSVKRIENNLRSKGLDENGSKSRNSLITSDSSKKRLDWIEQYEPGVYIALVDFQDGSKDIKIVRFSRRRFSEYQTKTWWSENGENVYNKYNISFSASNKAASKTEGVVPQGINGSKYRTSVGSNEGDANQTEVDWIELYEPQVYITLVDFQDGSRDIKKVLFSTKRFTEYQAETWWSENRENVYNKYNIRFSASNKAASKIEEVVPQGINGSKYRTSVGSNEGDANQTEVDWIEQYEPGVYIALIDFQDGSRDIKIVRFSRRRFSGYQPKTWWSENQENVYDKYNIRFSASNKAASKTERLVPKGINGSKYRTSVGSNEGYANQTEVDWIEQYEPQVYITLVDFQDGSRDIKKYEEIH